MRDLTADELVDALTTKQCRENLRQIYRAIEAHDETRDGPEFVASLQRAADEGARMAVTA